MMSNTGSHELKGFASRIERLENEKAEIAEAIKEVYAEVKDAGFTAKLLRKVVTERRKEAKDPAKYREEAELFDLYKDAVNGELFPANVTVTVEPSGTTTITAKPKKAAKKKAKDVSLTSSDAFEADDPGSLTVGGITYMTQEGADEARVKFAKMRDEMADIGGPTEDEQAFA